MGTPKKLARMTGILYLLVILAGVVSEIMVRSTLFVPGDIAATVSNILAYGFIFRIGFVISLTRFVIFILLVLALYKLLLPVHKDWSLVMLVLALVSITIGIAGLLFQYAAPLLLTGGDYSTLVTTDQKLALVQFFIDMQVQGDKAAQIFTLWVILLGYLMLKSGYFPKLLGILMMIAGVGYLADFLIFFLLPQLNVSIAGFAFLAELAFPFWLLIKGVDIEAWNRRALEAA